MAEDIRQVAEFRHIVLRDWGKLVLKQGELPSLIVEAEEEYLQAVSTTVERDTLVLRIGRKWLDVLKNTLESNLQRQKVTYYLTVQSLEGLDVSGAARVSAERLSGDAFSLRFGGAGEIAISGFRYASLDVEMPGAGKLSISGSVDRQQAMLSGAGSYLAGELDCAEAAVELRGIGKARVHVRERLSAVVRGVGTIEYSGEPEIDKTVTGLGQVRRVE